MSDERDQETTSRKVTSNSNTPLNRYSTSEERTTKVKDDGSSNAVIVFVLLFLAVGAGAVAYYLNNRPAPAPILVPSAVDTVKENKSTIIERNNTTIREVSPATLQPTPKVEITVQPQPVAPAPAVTVTAQPTATPASPPKAMTPSANPTPTTGSPNN
jgi:hypothetical protein